MLNKKLTALIMGVCTAVSLASCGEKVTDTRPIQVVTAAPTTEAATEPVTELPTFHERHDYEDGVLIGRWKSTEADVVLQENGKVSAEFDISEVMMIDSDGIFMLSGEEFLPEQVEYDGTELVIYSKSDESGELSEFLHLVRKDEPDLDRFDGVYEVETEYLRERLASAVIGSDASALDVELKIRHGHFIVSLPEFCDYTQKGDEFTLSFGDGSGDGFADSISNSTFVLDGDKCTFYNETGLTDIFTRKG